MNCSKGKFEKLVEQGVILAHRDGEMRWRVSKDSVLRYIRQRQATGGTRLITNNSHYEEVVERICSAKSSIKIMTANFKRFRLKPTKNQGKDYNDGTPFIERLMEKAGKGVSVQIICSRPSKSFKEEYDALYEKIKPKKFRIFFCERNHSKVVIVDNKEAYIGSANVTPAGLAQGIMSPGNFEIGILTENHQFISQLNTLFSKIMNGDYCHKCHLANKCVE